MQDARDKIAPGEIEVVGLGPGSPAALTLEAFEVLKDSEILYLRTTVHPTVEFLRERGINFQSFDDIYNSKDTFHEVYSEIVKRLISQAITGKRITYAVPGNPLIGENSVHMLLNAAKEQEIPVRIIMGLSFLSPMLSFIGYDSLNGLSIIDGADLRPDNINPRTGTIIAQVYNTKIASDIKLSLMEIYPDEHRVLLVRAAGVEGEERIEWLPLYEIDRIKWIDHLTSLYIPPIQDPVKIRGKEDYKWPLDPLVEIMEILRSEKGCPWDREQTHRSLRPYAIEEAYEVAEAINEGSSEHLQEELGDLLLQVVFHAQIGREDATFDMNSIIDTIVEKMIRRHPHVFGDVRIDTASGVLANWERIKRQEKGAKQRRSILDGIPKDLPSLAMAYKIQDKAAKVGFDWEDIESPIEKIFEEAEELRDAVKRREAELRAHKVKRTDVNCENGELEIEEEFGDLLFSIVNVARILKVQPELALRRTINKFYKRFTNIEEEAKRRGIKLQDMTLEDMDQIWNASKERANS